MNRTIFRELRSFLILWFGQTISQLGSAMTAFALNVWAFQQVGTVMSVSLLMVCYMAANALASMLAGTLTDRQNKKAIMLTADSAAAVVSLIVLALLQNQLRVEHLYAVNVLLGVSGAFQAPAASVVTSAMVPPKHYLRVSGLQSFSDSLSSILSPIFATAVLAFGGLRWVLAIDFGSFAVAFVTLSLTRLPPCPTQTRELPFGVAMRDGLGFLREHRGVSRLIGYQMLLNLVAGVAYYSVLTPMILARTGGNELILGTVNSFVGLGAMVGAFSVALLPHGRHKVRTMCIAYMLSFALCDFLLGVGRPAWTWCLAAFLGNLPLPVGDGCLQTLYRENIPLSLQGRVFATRNALVRLVTIAGYFLGALLADRVVEPLLALPACELLRALVGVGEGRAMGLIFVCSSVTGLLASLSVWRDPAVRALENEPSRARL